MPSAIGFLGHGKGLPKNATAAAFLSKVSFLAPHTSHPEKMKAPPMGWEMQELREMDGNQNETTTFVCLPFAFSLIGAPRGLLGSPRIPSQCVAPGLLSGCP